MNLRYMYRSLSMVRFLLAYHACVCIICCHAAAQQVPAMGAAGPIAPMEPVTQPPPPPPSPDQKPAESAWLLGPDPSQKTGFAKWLLMGGSPTYPDRHVEYPGYDGWYNNFAHPELGAIDTPLLRRVSAYYDDSVYKPVTKGRPNPLTLSEELMKGKIGSQSRTGKTALLVFFGQQVVEEILDAQRPACPPEYFNIDIPEGHEYRKRPKHTVMPFLRTRYDMRTGFSPGNPRQQLNEITPWLDGGLTYGTTKAWADQLRRYKNGTVDPDGKLACANDTWLFPEYNTHNLPLANPPPPALHEHWIKIHETARVNRFFKLGNPRGNENPFLLTFGVLWFRWHNLLAQEIREVRPEWKSERVFNEARKWVIASHQHIVIDEWLPAWLGTSLDRYEGYNPALDPQIDQFFQSAAMRFGHTLVTPGVYLRDYKRNKCRLHAHKVVRTCNFFWRSQEPMLWTSGHASSTNGSVDLVDIDRLLMGMATQLTEEEDHIIVEDLRGRVFGPLEFSRRDLMAINIQRGRDHGLPDFNSARKAYNLRPITSVDHFNITQEYKMKLEALYRNASDVSKGDDWLSRIDVWVGGLLETGDAPGELFRTIIKDQFTRIRDADRFWFENQGHGKLFATRELRRLKQLRLRDIIMSVTRMQSDDMQMNPFLAPAPDDPAACNLSEDLYEASCSSQPSGKCRVLLALTSGVVESCVPPGTYDYFTNSEISYIFTFLGLGVTIAGFIALLVTTNKLNELKRKKKNEKQNRKTTFLAADELDSSVTAHEWTGNKNTYRCVLVVLNAEKRHIEVLCPQSGTLLRAIDVSHGNKLDVFIISDEQSVMMRVANHHDLVLRFDGSIVRSTFLQKLETFVSQIGIHREVIKNITLNAALRQAVTKRDRQKLLEMFFRVVFAHAFRIQHNNENETLTLDAKLAAQVIYTELTITEFAEAISMPPDSAFAQQTRTVLSTPGKTLEYNLIKVFLKWFEQRVREQKCKNVQYTQTIRLLGSMFALIDKDRSGFISFREFVDMLVVFSKGSADDKIKLMFDMYDINATGQLTRQEFTYMFKSLMETVQADVEPERIGDLVNSMLMSAGLAGRDVITFENFQNMLSGHMDILSNLNFQGVFDGQEEDAGVSQHQHMRAPLLHRARETAMSIYGDPREYQRNSVQPLDAVNAARTVVQQQKTNTKWTGPACWLQLTRNIDNYRLEIFWCALYTLVILAIFAERAYYYSVEREHGGIRQIAGYGVTVTRGAASAMMFTYSSLLVTMCRNTITTLRATWLHKYIPFDAAVDMHKYVAVWALFFTVIHCVGHAFNFYHISTQTSNDLTCLFRNFFHSTHEVPKFHYWCWQTITGVTGILLVVFTALIFVFALPFSRQHLYNWFWLTHSMYPIFYLLCILHGAGRLIQEPFFHYFFLGPCILYTFDYIISLNRKKVEIPVLRSVLLPSDVTMLEIKRPNNFDYLSGQWVNISCTALNPNEYHPFTLSSAPNEKNLTLHIRAVGPWTSNLRRIYDPANYSYNAEDGGMKALPKIHLHGPFGESHQDWFQFEVAVLVGGGIGVTPFASILKDIVFHSNHTQLDAPCKKVYFLWVTKTQKHFEWLVDIIREVEKSDTRLVVSVHIFVTQFYEKFDLRTILLYICERHFHRICGCSFFTGLKAVTHFGRPNCDKIFQGIQRYHSKTRKIGVFSCGPRRLIQSVEEACIKANSLAESDLDPVFQHFSKNF